MMEHTILQMIAEAKPIPGPVTEASNLYTDLGFDSLSFIALLLGIEEAYSIHFHILEIENCLEVYQLVDLVNRKIAQEGGAL